MQIFVRTPTGKKMSLEVERSDTIGRVKEKIEEIEGTPPHHQLLIVPGKELEGPRTLMEYGMPRRNPATYSLYLSLKFEDEMRISVRTPTGNVLMLAVESSDTTVCNVKEKIQKIGGIPSDQQHLFIDGHKLENCKTLRDSNVKEESILKLDLCLVCSFDMQILVRTLTGKTIRLDVKSLDTIRNVKEKIQVIEGIPWDQQHLSFEGRQLWNEQTLRDYDIENGFIVELMLNMYGGGYRIFVKTFTGKTIYMSVGALDIIDDLKGKIEEIEGIPRHHQRLVTAAKILDDGTTLADHNIQEECTLDLVVRLTEFDMQIFVKIQTWKRIALEVDSSDAIEDVKKKIEEKEGIPLGQQRLVGKGYELQNWQTLGELYIRHKSTLNLIFRV